MTPQNTSASLLKCFVAILAMIIFSCMKYLFKLPVLVKWSTLFKSIILYHFVMTFWYGVCVWNLYMHWIFHNLKLIRRWVKRLFLEKKINTLGETKLIFWSTGKTVKKYGWSVGRQNKNNIIRFLELVFF